MSDTFSTVLSGVLVYVAGQMTLHFVLEPIKEFNKKRGEISSLVLFYRAKITNASEDEDAQRKIKEIGAGLMASMWQIPFYNALAFIRIFKLPKRAQVVEAAREMNGISFAMADSTIQNAALNNYNALKQIATLLRIDTSFD